MILGWTLIYTKLLCMFKYIQNYLNRFPKKIFATGNFSLDHGSLQGIWRQWETECFSLLVLECLERFCFLSLVSGCGDFFVFWQCLATSSCFLIVTRCFYDSSVNIQGQIISHKHTSPVLMKIISQRARDPLEDEIERNCGHMLFQTCIHYTSWLHVIQERPNRCKNSCLTGGKIL